MSTEDGEPKPERRSARSIVKRDFRAIEEGDEDFPDLSSESDGEGHAGRRRGRRGGGSSKQSGASRGKQRRMGAVSDLEAAARDLEVDIAELTPQAEACRERLQALTAENAALKHRLQLLEAQARINGAGRISPNQEQSTQRPPSNEVEGARTTAPRLPVDT